MPNGARCNTEKYLISAQPSNTSTLLYFQQATNRQFPQSVTGAYMSGMREAYRIIQDIRQDVFPQTGAKNSKQAKQRKVAKPRPGSRGKVRRGSLDVTPAKKAKTKDASESHEQSGIGVKEEPHSPAEQNEAQMEPSIANKEDIQENSLNLEGGKDSQSSLDTHDGPQDVALETISIPEANQNGSLSPETTQGDPSCNETSQDSILETSQDESVVHNSSMDSNLGSSQDVSMISLETSETLHDDSLNASVTNSDDKESTLQSGAKTHEIQKDSGSNSETTYKTETSTTVTDQIKSLTSDDFENNDIVNDTERRKKSCTDGRENDLVADNTSSEDKVETEDNSEVVSDKVEKLGDEDKCQEAEREEFGEEGLEGIKSECVTGKEESNVVFQGENDNILSGEIEKNNDTDILCSSEDVKDSATRDNHQDLEIKSQDTPSETLHETGDKLDNVDDKLDNVEVKMLEDIKSQSEIEDGHLLHGSIEIPELHPSSEDKRDDIVE